MPKISIERARQLISSGNAHVVVVRDAPEVEKSGKLVGATNVSRGMPEFRADPESPYHDKAFARKNSNPLLAIRVRKTFCHRAA